MAHPLSSYLSLLERLADDGFRFHPMRAWFEGRGRRPDAYLRHDVDRLPFRAVAMAEAEAALGVASTYYFRCDPRGRFPAPAIARVAGLGHEVGFHYECLSRTRGDVPAAVTRFAAELADLRRIAEVRTIAAHGAPASAHSNMAFAEALDLERLDLIGDAGTIAFDDQLYITDTGGTFGSPHNRRDRPPGRSLEGPTPPGALAGCLRDAGETRIVLSCHPERWPDTWPGYLQAALQDALINLAKRVFVSVRPPRSG